MAPCITNRYHPAATYTVKIHTYHITVCRYQVHLGTSRFRAVPHGSIDGPQAKGPEGPRALVQSVSRMALGALQRIPDGGVLSQ